MKLNHFNQYMGGILGAAMLLGMPSCSDDHYDIKPGMQSAGQTLWQNVEANPQLKSMAGLLTQLKVYTKEDDPNKEKMTYAQLLNSPQTFTLWAPKDGTFDVAYWQNQIDRVKQLREENNFEAANKLEYNLGVQFAQNHMARFNYESQKANQEVRLFNGKLCMYNAAEGVFNGAKMSAADGVIPSSNGTLHLLESISPYAHNIFDYMEANSDIFENVYGTLSDPAIDKKEFSEALSIPGALNENGQMVYVDSVFISDNELLNLSGAQIMNEDSMYIAVIPTDQAWDATIAKYNSLFKYKDTYKCDYNVGTGKYGNEFPAKGQTFDSDSLQNYNARKSLITSMYFSPSYFTEDFERDDVEGILNYAYYADSLLSTNGIYYANPTKGQKNPLFGNVEPVKASNGIIFPLTSYDFDPAYSWVQKYDIDATISQNIGFTDGVQIGNERGILYTLNEDVNWDTNVDISEMGKDKRNYCYFPAKGKSSTMSIDIPLPNVLSGKYRVKIQLVPSNANYNTKWMSVEDPEKELDPVIRFYAYFKDDYNKDIAPKSEVIQVENDAVKTYTIWESVDVPYCYAGLPSTVNNSFPVIRLVLDRKEMSLNTPKENPLVPFGLGIAKIIVEPVRE